MPAWVLLVTGGTVIEYPPELYLDPVRATDEAERWAWILSGAGWAEIERPFAARWEVGDRSVRLVEIAVPAASSLSGAWVGTFWDRSGAPDPEALLLESRDEAGRWVRDPPVGANPAARMEEQPWFAVERRLEGTSRPTRGVVIVGLLPLLPFALLGGTGVFIALGALAVWAIGRASPRIVAAWNSPPIAWLGRVVLIAVAARALVEVVRDTAEVL